MNIPYCFRPFTQFKWKEVTILEPRSKPLLTPTPSDILLPMIAPTTPTDRHNKKLLCLADDVISTLQREGYLELTGEQNWPHHARGHQDPSQKPTPGSHRPKPNQADDMARDSKIWHFWVWVLRFCFLCQRKCCGSRIPWGQAPKGAI